MSVKAEERDARPANSRLLYCALDHRVTRHTIRESEGLLVCAECGHRVDLARARAAKALNSRPEQQTVPFKQVGGRTRGPRGAIKIRRQRRPRELAILLGVATVVGIAAIFYAWSSLTASPVAAPFTAELPRPQTERNSEAARPAASAASVRVANTQGQGAYVRKTTNLDDRLKAWPDGTPLRVTGPDTTVNGIQWKPVEDPDGNRGWIPAEYTQS